LFRADAISSQLPTRRLNQIDFSASGELELSRDLRTYFEAARTDSRSNGDDQILRFAVEALTHGLYRFRRDLRYYAAPPGMNRRYCPSSRIGDQNGETIGGPDRKADARQIRDQGVALALKPWGFHDQNAVRVNLLGGSQLSADRPSSTQPSPKPVLDPCQVFECLRSKNVIAAAPEQSSL
jgi:hypothetical protein